MNNRVIPLCNWILIPILFNIYANVKKNIFLVFLLTLTSKGNTMLNNKANWGEKNDYKIAKENYETT